MKFGLEDNIIKRITRVLEEQPKMDEAYIFGSRAKGNYRPDSDIDIAVKGDDLTVEDILKMSAAIDKLNIEFEVDLVDYGNIKEESLLEHIDRVGILLIDSKVDYKIEDLAIFLNEKRVPLSSMERSKKKGIYPYYGASGIVDYIDEYVFTGEYVLISEDGENLKTRQTPIAFPASGKFWVNNHAHIVKGKKPFANKLLVYYFENLDLTPYLTGAVQPKLNKSTLASIPIRVPKRESVQIAIVNTLSSLDEKADLLERQNKTLETLAELLFKRWFVENAEGHWKKAKLKDVITVKGGTTPSSSNPDFWNGTISWTTPKDLSNNKSVFLFETERKISSKGLSQIGSGLLPAGTLLLSSRAPIGYLAITQIPIAINQGYIGILCDKGISNYFMYLWCKNHMGDIHNAGNGSVFQEISKSSFKELEIVIPPKKLQEQFDEIVETLFEKMKNNTIQIMNLTGFRDALLPKLLSGEARVKMP